MSLFKRKCDAPGHDETLISLYPPDENLVTYDINFWWSDKWDPINYGQKYDFSQSFFYQLLMNNFHLVSNIHQLNEREIYLNLLFHSVEVKRM
jgi:hypothetical protein